MNSVEVCCMSKFYSIVGDFVFKIDKVRLWFFFGLVVLLFKICTGLGNLGGYWELIEYYYLRYKLGIFW